MKPYALTLFRRLPFVLVVFFIFHALPARAVLIDFSTFDAGDGLAEVNAVASPLGATFMASSAGPFSIVSLGSGSVARASTDLFENDFLVNFGAPVNFVQVVFADDADGVGLSSAMNLFFTPRVNTADVSGLIATLSGSEPVVLTSMIPGVQSVSMESVGDFVYISSIEFTFVDPPPVAVAAPAGGALLALGIFGVMLFRRRRTGQTQLINGERFGF